MDPSLADWPTSLFRPNGTARMSRKYIAKSRRLIKPRSGPEVLDQCLERFGKIRVGTVLEGTLARIALDTG